MLHCLIASFLHCLIASLLHRPIASLPRCLQMYVHAKRLLLESSFNFFVAKLGDVTGATATSTAAAKRMLRGNITAHQNRNTHHIIARSRYQNNLGLVCILD